MNDWDPPVWVPPDVDGNVDGGGDLTSTASAAPRLPPATTHHIPSAVTEPNRIGPTVRGAAVRARPRPSRRRVPAWIWVGAACVAAAGVFAIAGPDADPQRAQFPGGVEVAGAQPTGATTGSTGATTGSTIIVPATTAPPTTGAPPPPTTVVVQPLLPQTSCHPSYAPCVPIDDDVDCAGGSGNGPSYVSGPIRVIGDDEYGLDDDGDGVGCEP